MARGAKRLDLQFGSFACSVQGFEDPVEPVQQVLRTLQHMLEETPELATAGFAFEADTIEQLIEEVGRRAELDDSEIEIVPGLIIIHHGGLKRDAHAAGADTDSDEARDEPGYVNIFAPSAHAAGEVPEYEPFEDAEELETVAGDDAAPEHAGLIADRLGRAASGDANMPRDIFAEPAEGVGSDGNVFADAAAGEESAAHPSSSVNFFSTPLDPVRRSASNRDESPSEVEEAVAVRLFPGRDGGAEDPDVEDEAPDEPAEAAEETTATGLAEKVAAESVPDLIVSAAAWMVLFKGQTTFSRKDVLGVFDTMPGEHAKSLEARIKGFGKAVRNGQLVMIEDGVFGLSRKELKRFQDVL